MPPKKKSKKNTEGTLKHFIDVLRQVSKLYEKEGETHKAKTFSNGAKNLTTFGDVTNKTEEVLESSKAFKDVKGVGKSILAMMDEFIETGTCLRIKELEQVTLGDDITREDLRELVINGDEENRHREALEQLIKEEEAFLKQAKTDLRKALDKFPYAKITYNPEERFGLISQMTHEDKATVIPWGNHKMRIYHCHADHEEATIRVKCGDFDDQVTCRRWNCNCGMLEDQWGTNLSSFCENEYLQSLNPEGDLEDVAYEIFRDTYDLRHVPE
jgi:hypothetical protein